MSVTYHIVIHFWKCGVTFHDTKLHKYAYKEILCLTAVIFFLEYHLLTSMEQNTALCFAPLMMTFQYLDILVLPTGDYVFALVPYIGHYFCSH